MLSLSAQDPPLVGEELRMSDDFAAITPAEVRQAAARWLGKRPITVIVTGRGAPGGAP
jgi:hypothetical protein